MDIGTIKVVLPFGKKPYDILDKQKHVTCVHPQRLVRQNKKNEYKNVLDRGIINDI